MTTKLTDEAALVSQAGALIQMQKQLSKAFSTNFVPRHVRASMPGTCAAVDTIMRGYQAAIVQVHAESKPHLEAWCGRLGLLVGCIFAAKLLASTDKHENLEATGPIVAVRLHDGLVDQQRVVEIVVRKVRFYRRGKVIAAEAIAGDLAKLLRARTILEDTWPDPATGATEPVIRFRVGITPVARRKGVLRDVEVV